MCPIIPRRTESFPETCAAVPVCIPGIHCITPCMSYDNIHDLYAITGIFLRQTLFGVDIVSTTSFYYACSAARWGYNFAVFFVCCMIYSAGLLLRVGVWLKCCRSHPERRRDREREGERDNPREKERKREIFPKTCFFVYNGQKSFHVGVGMTVSFSGGDADEMKESLSCAICLYRTEVVLYCSRCSCIPLVLLYVSILIYRKYEWYPEQFFLCNQALQCYVYRTYFKCIILSSPWVVTAT